MIAEIVTEGNGRLTRTKQSWKWMRSTPGAAAGLAFKAELTAAVMIASALGQLLL
jgi:hypothetical protein